MRRGPDQSDGATVRVEQVETGSRAVRDLLACVCGWDSGPGATTPAHNTATSLWKLLEEEVREEDSVERSQGGGLCET